VRLLPTVEVVPADVHDEAQLRRLVAGHDAVVNWWPSCTAVPQPSSACMSMLPQKLAAACTAAGVRRLVHVSALGVGPEAPSNYLRSKTRARRC
jgi:uncharacterized protein YbjT (DUF2867 family)